LVDVLISGEVVVSTGKVVVLGTVVGWNITWKLISFCKIKGYLISWSFW
jgi:hypothetical protein